jgi:hypothetical protein
MHDPDFTLLGSYKHRDDVYYGALALIASQVPLGGYIIEAGTRDGAGADALGASGHRVCTYDIINWPKKLSPNVEFCQGSCHDIPLTFLSGASLVYLDIDPHDGDAEILFYNRLKASGFFGWLFCDDINFPAMKKFWDHVDLPKQSVGERFGFVNFETCASTT